MEVAISWVLITAGGDMSDKHGSLVGRRIVLFLKTPLFRLKFRDGQSERQLMENAVRVGGKVKSDHAAGFHLEVSELSNLKEIDKKPPFREVIIPYEKVDFVIFDD